jgi:hypothetical protein
MIVRLSSFLVLLVAIQAAQACSFLDPFLSRVQKCEERVRNVRFEVLDCQNKRVEAKKHVDQCKAGMMAFAMHLSDQSFLQPVHIVKRFAFAPTPGNYWNEEPLSLCLETERNHTIYLEKCKRQVEILCLEFMRCHSDWSARREIQQQILASTTVSTTLSTQSYAAWPLPTSSSEIIEFVPITPTKKTIVPLHQNEVEKPPLVISKPPSDDWLIVGQAVLKEEDELLIF